VRSDYFTHILQSIAGDILTFEFQEMYVVTASLREYKLPHRSPTTGYIFKKGETGNVFALPISLVSLRDRLHVYILQCIAKDIFPLNLQRIYAMTIDRGNIRNKLSDYSRACFLSR